MGVLHTDRAPKRQYVIYVTIYYHKIILTPVFNRAAQKVLHALETFGNNLDDYLHLVIPAVVRLFERSETPPSVRII